MREKVTVEQMREKREKNILRDEREKYWEKVVWRWEEKMSEEKREKNSKKKWEKK